MLAGGDAGGGGVVCLPALWGGGLVPLVDGGLVDSGGGDRGTTGEERGREMQWVYFGGDGGSMVKAAYGWSGEGAVLELQEGDVEEVSLTPNP